jgi:hypothetical protein
MVSDELIRPRVAEIVSVVYAGGGLPTGSMAAEQPAEWDSLRHIEIILAVVEEFGIAIAADDFASLRSIDAIAAHINSLHAAD